MVREEYVSEFELGSRRQSVSMAASVHSNPNPKDVSSALHAALASLPVTARSRLSGQAGCTARYLRHVVKLDEYILVKLMTCVHTLSDMGTLYLPTPLNISQYLQLSLASTPNQEGLLA